MIVIGADALREWVLSGGDNDGDDARWVHWVVGEDW